MTVHESQFITPDQLCIGLYIHLDVAWTRHPFAVSNFKIKDKEQIHTIRSLGLESIRYDSLRSDCAPLSLESAPAATQLLSEASAAPTRVAFLSDQVKRTHQAIRESEQHFTYAIGAARQALHKIKARPDDALAEAESLINDMVGRAMLEDSAIVQYMDGSRFAEDAYFHPLNVTVLCLMMAKVLKLSVEDARCLGMAALFHDIGKIEVPSGVLMNHGSLNKAELALLHQHAEYGANIISGIKKTSGLKRVAKLISQHHEYADGSGYPAKLKGAEIDALAGILSLANSYDHLCNPHNLAEAMTPYSALARLFSSERKKHDGSLLNVFIKMLGIYPPGSVVMLSDGSYGVVVSVNPQQLLRPIVMLHDKRMARDVPNILDLSEDEDVGINQCIHASQLPPEVASYLQCRQKLSYYFRAKQRAGEASTA